MRSLGREHAALSGPLPARPERVLQVGEGKFIRAFVDWLLQELGREGLFDGSVVLTPARAHGKPTVESLRAQDGLFTVWTRGIANGEVIDRLDTVGSIARIVDPFEDWAAFLACAEQAAIDIVVSNTTEAGIAYLPTPRPGATAPESFPARLAAYLAHRFRHFEGSPEAGMILLPTELIEDNGGALREAVLRHARDWKLGAAFESWLLEHNAFCNTLVDRIVPGIPDDPSQAYGRLGYTDAHLAVAEPFYLWAIDADPRAMGRLPFHLGALHVRYTGDLAPYRIQKLRVLNGTHTFLAPLGLMLGCGTVREAMTHPVLGPLTRQLVSRVTVRHSELEAAVLLPYADTVFERFLNPFIAHQLGDITLGALGKFRIRLLPILTNYAREHGEPPRELSAGLAALLGLYRPTSTHRARDDSPAAALATAAWTQAPSDEEALRRILADEGIWGIDLTRESGLLAQVGAYTGAIRRGHLELALKDLLPPAMGAGES